MEMAIWCGGVMRPLIHCLYLCRTVVVICYLSSGILRDVDIDLPRDPGVMPMELW